MISKIQDPTFVHVFLVTFFLHYGLFLKTKLVQDFLLYEEVNKILFAINSLNPIYPIKRTNSRKHEQEKPMEIELRTSRNVKFENVLLALFERTKNDNEFNKFRIQVDIIQETINISRLKIKSQPQNDKFNYIPVPRNVV